MPNTVKGQIVVGYNVSGAKQPTVIFPALTAYKFNSYMNKLFCHPLSIVGNLSRQSIYNDYM